MATKSIENILVAHQIEVGTSPATCDVAIVSVDDEGTPGELNKYVMSELGYSSELLPDARLLRHGYFLLIDKQKKSILFIVTVGRGNTKELLLKNLHAGLKEMYSHLRGSVWIPLIGTGTGGLTLENSFEAISKILNSLRSIFDRATVFHISVPDNRYGNRFLKQIGFVRDDEVLPKEVLRAFDNFKGRYFLAGSIWDDNDEQAPRFFEENIWENGREKKFIELVRKVDLGDIIFLTSTYAHRETGFLRIKGVGKVTFNSGNGTELQVDWKLKEILVDISGLGKYRNTISDATGEDLEKILSIVGKVKIYESGVFEISKLQSNRSTIAELISDSVTDSDHLQLFDRDVLAFAKIMASINFNPPLAVALFGKWGSGKSFFMGQLKKKIKLLSDETNQALYCKGIAHIHFNAWSYLDANLWASIVTRIFEGLSDYIKDDSKAKKEKDIIERELSHKLTVTKEEINHLEKQKKAVTLQISELSVQHAELNKQLNKDIATIEKNTLNELVKTADKEFNAVGRIGKTIQDNPTWQITEGELKQIVPEQYWQDPKAAYQQIQSTHVFLKEFFKRDKLKHNLIWLSLILLIIFIAPLFIQIITDKLTNFNFLLPQAGLSILIAVGAAWKRAEVVYKKLHPIIAAFWVVKIDHEKKLEETVSKFEQNEKALKLKIEKSKNELVAVNLQIQQAKATESDLTFRINNALATEALYSFIEKRTNSDDYKKYLGIVSMIRKDFEILSSLFVEHKNESYNGAEFNKKFDRPLQRIILYVDDLDRCPEDRVVEVLEAVNLLMAFPLFIVVVGVDPRWVKNALIKRYQIQFSSLNNVTSLSSDETIEASNYLEKIFQVPFHLKEASDDSVKQMLKNLINPSVTPNSAQTIESSIFTPSLMNQLPVIDGTSAPSSQTNTPTVQNQAVDTKLKKQSEHLALTDKEVELIQDFAGIIGNNPRAIKRFVNIYQIVRAHEDLTYFHQDEQKEFLIIMFLLALSIGPYKKLNIAFKRFIENPLSEEKPLSVFLNKNHKLDTLNHLKHELDVIMSNGMTFSILQREQAATFLHHNKFVERFTFEEF